MFILSRVLKCILIFAHSVDYNSFHIPNHLGIIFIAFFTKNSSLVIILLKTLTICIKH